MPDVLAARHPRDIQRALDTQRKSDAALRRLWSIEKAIRQMTRIYQERLDGKRIDDER